MGLKTAHLFYRAGLLRRTFYFDFLWFLTAMEVDDGYALLVLELLCNRVRL